MIIRYSSRLKPLDESFLKPRLEGAKSYDRIAGFFSSSILEVAGEQIDEIEGKIRVVCNSHLDERDVVTSQAAQGSLRREWCDAKPEEMDISAAGRFARLYKYLTEGRIEVRVLPDFVFGLIHGKAGVIVKSDGSSTSFMGSANESLHGFKLNYELIWEDDSPEAVAWVKKEFHALWNDPRAIPLPSFVIQDIGRIARRTVIPSVQKWKEDPNEASAVIETPVYRRELGLWEHQKYFVSLAFKAHQTTAGARFVLADMVGLGKTLQLALSAQLMALIGNQPVLVIAPKSLRWQWQNEMKELLDLPSAVWDHNQWVDERNIRYPASGDAAILDCPRRIGIVSAQLISYSYKNPDKNNVGSLLLRPKYECIIVDEAHHARRGNLGVMYENEKAEPNNLLAFLQSISQKTKSMLLATATPVQIHPIEAFDLLSILSEGSHASVLGTEASFWRKYPLRSLRMVQGQVPIPNEDTELWRLITNPLPPASEGVNYQILREQILHEDDETCWIAPERGIDLEQPDKDFIRNIAPEFIRNSNPYIRHIIRRTRSFLETTVNPETREPYLKKIEVKLLGDENSDGIPLPVYLEEAYSYAEQFCRALASRAKGHGFLKTLLLRRVGSTLVAGRKTAEAMLRGGLRWDASDEYEEEDTPAPELYKDMPGLEKELLSQFVAVLRDHEETDPKYHRVKELLIDEGWLERGCIVFSQYYDSIEWLAEKLKADLEGEVIGIYAGGKRSGVIEQGQFRHMSREYIKSQIGEGYIRLLLATDAAREGLNLQQLGCLINLDLPWNPTSLEQRKGRIQRIGQRYNEVWIYNMRYKDSVEDKVHEVLSQRLKEINEMFGQIPDVLKAVWVQLALDEIEDARKTIDLIPQSHPFEMRYDKIEPIDWESCTKVLDSIDRLSVLLRGW